MRKIILKKRFFTLLEIFLCIAILLMISTFLGMKGYSALEKHRFHSGHKRILAKMHFCRTLALNDTRDYGLYLENREGGVFLQLLTNGIHEHQGPSEILPGIILSKNPVYIGFSTTGTPFPSQTFQIQSLKESALFTDINPEKFFNIEVSEEANEEFFHPKSSKKKK